MCTVNFVICARLRNARGGLWEIFQPQVTCSQFSRRMNKGVWGGVLIIQQCFFFFFLPMSIIMLYASLSYKVRNQELQLATSFEQVLSELCMVLSLLG